MKVFLISLYILLLYGCAQRMKVPISRGISPESQGNGFLAQFDQKTFIDNKLQVDESVDLDDEVSSSTVKQRSLSANVPLGRQFEIYSSISSGVSPLIGLKVQFWGLPKSENSIGHKASLTIATGNGSDTYTNDLEISVESKIQDYSLIHGYRFNENFLVYESFSITEYEFKGKVINPLITFTKDRFNFKAKNAQTFAFGIIGSLSAFDFDFECAFHKFRFNESGYRTVFGTMLGASVKF